MNVKPIQSGFTLVEIAIVLLIVTILLGYTVAMFPLQQELKQYRHVEAEMDSITQHLIAFAQVNGRLPCPDTAGDVNGTTVAGVVDGLEDTDDLVDANGDPGTDGLVDSCKAFFGFVPARTLGMTGKFNAAGVLIDPWDGGYGYAISQFDFGDNRVDLVTANGIRVEGMANVVPDLFICDDSTALGDHLNCAAVTGGNEVLGSNGEVAAVIISLGKDFAIPATSNIQAENVDSFNDGTTDKVYIFSPRRDDYDDVVRWVSTNLLFSKMIEANQLP